MLRGTHLPNDFARIKVRIFRNDKNYKTGFCPYRGGWLGGGSAHNRNDTIKKIKNGVHAQSEKWKGEKRNILFQKEKRKRLIGAKKVTWGS